MEDRIMGMYSYGGVGTAYNGILKYLRKIGKVHPKVLEDQDMLILSSYVTQFLISKGVKFKRPKHTYKRLNFNQDWHNAIKVQKMWNDFVLFTKTFVPPTFVSLQQVRHDNGNDFEFSFYDNPDIVYNVISLGNDDDDKKYHCGMVGSFKSPVIVPKSRIVILKALRYDGKLTSPEGLGLYKRA